MDLSNPEEQQEIIKALYALNNGIANAIKRGDKTLNFIKLVKESVEIKTQLDQLPQPELKNLLQLKANTDDSRKQ